MRFLCYGRTAKDNKIQFSVKNKKKCDALLYFSTICSVSLQEHFALFRHKKQSLRNCCRILNINLVIGIYKSNTSKLQILPIPTRHLQIQYQQIADASEPRICICKSNSSKLQMLPTPGQASTNPIPANCRYFQPRPGIYKSNSSKLQMLPNPTRHLQIQIQQIADTSEPGQASANPNPANCRCFQPRSGIYKSNSSKLQMLPTPTRHLQIQYQQIADTSNPDQASAATQNNKSKMPTGEFLLKFAGGHLYCISISSNSYICLFLIHRGLSRPVSWHLFWVFPVFHRFPYAHLWKSLPTRQLLLLSVPDGFCPR